MSIVTTASNVTAPTQFLESNGERYAYRRFGSGLGCPLLFLQHFMGTLDNWDSAITDPLASEREVILFDNATYPDAGHGSLFQFHQSFVRQAELFLDSEIF